MPQIARTEIAGPAVRTDSLVERRGFEPPVLFGLFSLGKGNDVGPFFWPELAAGSFGEQFSDRLQRSNPVETSSLHRLQLSKPLGANASIGRRPADAGTGPNQLLDHLRKGDVLMVWKLDRLSRSLRDVLIIMERLAEAKAGFRSLTEAIDTTTLAGRVMMQMVGAFAEFERAMLRERTKAGLDAARREGRVGGRRPKLSPQQQTEIRKMVARGDKTAADAARLFKIHPATVSRAAGASVRDGGKGNQARRITLTELSGPTPPTCQGASAESRDP